ncbi:right-handed parallel beta-helix repeat-containing protein [Clostridium taeniosporum]|uniref:Cell wall-binding protein n=1 Tax=Clostridium taeniosporum TaxID=394958 RepID=A0A1D7XKQ0_9CLOT|nr:right-handed parallel beta-helix repeat-containing protein [Clostridium taeniosporum]AOR23867.1 cell wall-binding protein [Clostridium taeniosporum]
MIKIKFKKILASLLIVTSILTLTPIDASASWKQNSIGWWYTIDNSWATGWMKIHGRWYYFYSNGYMAHDTIIDGFKLGSDGAWIITQPKTSTINSNEKIIDITVETTQEFVNAIGSNKRIFLKPGVYNLTNIKQINNTDNSVVWETVADGKELNIQGINNLTIEGLEAGKVEIKTTPRYANIMNFTNSSNITIKNIIAGHTPAPYECNAGVIKFSNSNDISIMNSKLYGCGSIGLDLNDVKRFQSSNCKIDHCSLRAIQIYNSQDIKFTENKILNHEAYSNIIMIDKTKDVKFEKCELADNNNFGWSFIEASGKSNILLNKCIIKNNSKPANSKFNTDKIYFFDTIDYFGIGDSKITVKDSEISNNKCDYLLDDNKNVKLQNCNINNNTWK